MDLLAIGTIALDQIFEVDRLPQYHHEGVIQCSGTYYGGRAPNVAAMAAKLGVSTGIVSPVGDDFVSSGYEEHLSRLGVDLRGVARVPGQKTKQILIFTDTSGQQIAFFQFGAECGFKNMEVPTCLIQESKIVHISSGDYRFNVECAELAHRYDVLVSFDVGNDPFTEIAEYLDGMIRHTTLLFMNDVELASVLDRLGLEQVSDLLEYGPTAIVVISKQDRSSCVITRASIEHIGSAMSDVRDPTGASDGYVAGFLAAYARGNDLRSAGTFGASELSFIVESIGCQTNLPDWHQLLKRRRRLFNLSR